MLKATICVVNKERVSEPHGKYDTTYSELLTLQKIDLWVKTSGLTSLRQLSDCTVRPSQNSRTLHSRSRYISWKQTPDPRGRGTRIKYTGLNEVLGKIQLWLFTWNIVGIIFTILFSNGYVEKPFLTLYPSLNLVGSAFVNWMK